ncbi:MAG: hypothetical protein COA78_20435 [Blastopirellula sp.]|nr:MAG: hypothetical protein COA78_20435 [Blastopirellula sp.]
MNRNDLEDIIEFDLMQAFFSSIGIFFMAGSFWLGIEKVLEQDAFFWTPIIIICVLSFIVGVVFAFVGFRMRNRKIHRINRIFKETEPATTAT